MILFLPSIFVFSFGDVLGILNQVAEQQAIWASVILLHFSNKMLMIDLVAQSGCIELKLKSKKPFDLPIL